MTGKAGAIELLYNCRAAQPESGQELSEYSQKDGANLSSSTELPVSLRYSSSGEAKNLKTSIGEHIFSARYSGHFAAASNQVSPNQFIRFI